MYKRAEYQIIKNRLEEPRKFIQVVMGARQIGKSTVVKQVLKDLDLPYLFYSADNVPASNTAWVSDCWEAVRSLKRSNNWETAILVIDEIQKVSNWSEVVKKEWDDDSFNDRNIDKNLRRLRNSFRCRQVPHIHQISPFFRRKRFDCSIRTFKPHEFLQRHETGLQTCQTVVLQYNKKSPKYISVLRGFFMTLFQAILVIVTK